MAAPFGVLPNLDVGYDGNVLGQAVVVQSLYHMFSRFITRLSCLFLFLSSQMPFIWRFIACHMHMLFPTTAISI